MSLDRPGGMHLSVLFQLSFIVLQGWMRKKGTFCIATILLFVEGPDSGVVFHQDPKPLGAICMGSSRFHGFLFSPYS